MDTPHTRPGQGEPSTPDNPPGQSDTTPDAIEVTVVSDPEPDGAYRCEIRVTGVAAFTVDAAAAVGYAHTVLTVAAYAEFGAAVYAQLVDVFSGRRGMTPLGSPDEIREVTRAVTTAVAQAASPTADSEATGPLRFEPAMSSHTGEPAVHLEVDGRTLGHWVPAQAREHALGVIQATVAGQVGTAYRQVLIDALNLDEASARTIVADLPGYHPTIPAPTWATTARLPGQGEDR